MKKFGFTLSELLVAIGVIAVGAALIAPMFSNIIPDKNKMKTIGYYNKINEINQILLSNPLLYYTTYKYNDNGELTFEYPADLTNILQPLRDYDFIGNNLSPENKYPNLFFYTLISSAKNNREEVELEDGSLWKIESLDYDNGDYKFTIDLNGKNNGKNCSYGQENCKKTDIHIFKVDRNGAVTAGDALTDAYLTNATTVNNQKADRELAKKYLSEKNYQ